MDGDRSCRNSRFRSESTAALKGEYPGRIFHDSMDNSSESRLMIGDRCAGTIRHGAAEPDDLALVSSLTEVRAAASKCFFEMKRIQLLCIHGLNCRNPS